MKLIGSKLEQDFRDELLRSNQALQEPNSRLRMALESNGYPVSNALVLQWTPEQLEDIFLVLIDGCSLVRVEIEKDVAASLAKFEKLQLTMYERGLSRMNQVRLAVAKNLACSKT